MMNLCCQAGGKALCGRDRDRPLALSKVLKQPCWVAALILPSVNSNSRLA